MNLLFSIDNNFTKQFLIALYSIMENTSARDIDVYVLQKEELRDTELINKFCNHYQINYHPVIIGEHFEDAPQSERYPRTVYYRLLAHRFLPEDLEKILYLDADILVINDIEELYNINLGDKLYGASIHTFLLRDVTNTINEKRLEQDQAEGYYNSGVLLMNLPKIRQDVHMEDINEFIEKNKKKIILPDQDVLNGLYGHRIMSLPDQKYNYDARKNYAYFLENPQSWNVDLIFENTIILHYCGKNKPWNSKSLNPYHFLYKHYENKFNILMKKLIHD